MKKAILKKLLLPMASKLTSNKGWDYYKQYIVSDFDPIETRKKRQWNKLKRLIEHAYTNVPFYRNKFDKAGIKPEHIKDESDFRKIPVTTKKELRDNVSKEYTIAENYPSKNLRFSNTSGTTGPSLILMHDHEDINYKYASKLRSRHLMGCDIEDSIMRITSNECQPCLPNGESPDVGFLKYLQMVLSNHEYKQQAYYILLENKIINPFIHRRHFSKALRTYFNNEDMEHYVKEIKKYKPDMIVGYPLYLFFIARYIKEKGIKLTPIKAVELTAGLSFDSMRSFIGEQFKAPVYQIYGGCELGRVAGSCVHSNGLMHILEDHAYIEFIKSSGEIANPGELSNIIVTSLNSYGMPFIRYEHGDVGKYFDHQCHCGRSAQLMDVEGRIMDLIVNKDGVPLSSQVFIESFLGYKGIKLFQLIQKNLNVLEFRIVKESPLANINIIEINNKIKEIFGYEVNVEFKYVDYINPAASGKYRLVRSATYESFRCVEDKNQELGNFW
ncbi:MAG: hypothetical protein KKD07_10580 [Candidatus Omnitrophica bacterium]|nr:hypothetical protein [Candidatus Omnitrophota bacterium]MBU1996065.1 hypothetical protein [Candidatus Omnitrophota bacterium]MBU4334875.1 hypothetical protein [Candidatus Omnitrophota bacterium]